MSNSPIEVKRAGPVKATIWENTNDTGKIYHSIDISRSYRDGDGKWHETNQLFTEQLPMAEIVANKAYSFIHDRLNELSSERKNGEPQKAEESDQPAPAKKRAQRKSHVEKVEEERKTAAKSK